MTPNYWRKTDYQEEGPDGRLSPVYVADTIDIVPTDTGRQGMGETPDQRAERLQALITRLVASAEPLGGDAWRVIVRVDVDAWIAIVEAASAEDAQA